MSPVTVSIRPVVSYDPIVRALAVFILVASTLFIIFAALFPFDFYFPRAGLWPEIVRKFDSSTEPSTLEDRVQNLLFFVPFGFGFAACIRGRTTAGRQAARVLGALACGFALTMTVEVLQVFLGFRDPTWSDVIMNTIGAGVGAAIVAGGGDQVLDSIARPLAQLKPYATARNVTIVLVVYVLVQLALPLLWTERGSLENWDPGYPLLVGNEADGERGWNGTVWRVELASRAASADEVQRLHHDADAMNVFDDALVGSFELTGIGPYPDRTQRLRDLNWVGEIPREPPTTGPDANAEPARVTERRWLRTPVGIAPATHRIRQTSQFTLAATFAPDQLFQRGPARIISISGGGYVRNASIMHDHYHLSLRLRTPLLGRDGSAPEMIVEDVFDSPAPKHVVLSYADPLLVVYVNGEEHGRMEITPEAAAIWRLYPRTGWKVKLGRYGFRSYAAVYRMLVLIPFAALLAAATALSLRPARIEWLFIAGAILGTAVALELILGSLTVSGFQPRNLALSVIIATVAVSAIRLWFRHPHAGVHRGR